MLETLENGHERGMVAHDFNPSFWETEAGSVFKASQGYVERPCFKKTKQNKT